ncbi:uncharacterized protein TRAVEDRAFT_163113 [Trametes versicolor FP-101664 SS1]|uniref:uncharacterized protein n=1 Tax=Trametes versicolor (strain FP-101664) TaxID=717944 RepID=UPI000462390D|nr:uncharacterized protein TRAVEDRAFT_163113 [Trametes versicolor FP-101664 SS1]EIW61678.1 hypothetical protein TRAVEDRAFT_163113 [Trametes versicolor FP-101664 SS1]
MLGARTKQVFAYGRRGHRIVNVSDDADRRNTKEADHVDTRRENAVPESPLVSSKTLKTSVVQKSSQRAGTGKKSPKVVKVGAAVLPKSKRHVLGSFAPNAPASPAVAAPLKAKRHPTVAKRSALAPSSPIVNLDIVVLDGQGRRVSQERRISRSDVTANVLAAPALEPKAPARAKAKKQDEPIVLSSGTEDEAPAARPKRTTRIRKAAPIIISDDENSGSGSDYAPPSAATSLEADSSLEISTPIPKAKRGPARTRVNVVLSPPPSPSPSPPSSPLATPPAHVDAFHSPVPQKKADLPSVSVARTHTLPSQPLRPQQFAPFASLSQIDEAGPSRSKPRCLTPIRARPRRALFPAPPSPPSPTTPTDLDVTFDFAQLALSPNALAEVQQLGEAGPLQPAHIRPLLEECAQAGPHEFSAFIEMFPFDPIVQDTSAEGAGAGPPRFLKIGEASFSEVFGIGGVVLKIIPLRDEERMGALDGVADGPAPSDAKDVLKEMIVTRAMGATCPGFVELLRTYVVRGKYPSLLLDLWDEYDERKGSEGVRPDTFGVSQLYAIIVLPNGGPDLEAYTFSSPTKTGWRQACSVFWQVARTLADAEELVSFEHRDLHWGQILVKNVTSAKGAAGRRKSRTSMDDAAHGVLVTVIDLGLARMDAHDAGGHRVHWTPFDEETFEGEGDYQFDVYRMMRQHNGDAWEDYRPLTNVMWLHYLAVKLLKSKRLRAPAAARKSTAAAPAAAFSERDCYECLKEVEALLAQCLAPQAPRKGRRKTQAPGKAGKAVPGLGAGPQSAGELVALAVERAWVS